MGEEVIRKKLIMVIEMRRMTIRINDVIIYRMFNA
jgi:hypothetical protein